MVITPTDIAVNNVVRRLTRELEVKDLGEMT